jgi:putative intracellular protease/amidase
MPRRFLVAVKRVVLASLLLLGALPAFAIGPKQAPAGPKNVAILLFPGVQIIDYTGPWEVLGHAYVDGRPGFQIYSVAETASPFDTAMGMTVIPSYTFAKAPEPDVLVLPGGNVSPQLSNEGLIRWVRETARKADVVLSVCNGAFFLAEAGLLDGLEATTFAGMIDDLQSAAPKARVVRDKRFVDNGKIVTAAGLSSGIDGALHVIEKLYGRGTAQVAAVGMEYDWRPDSGWARASLADRHLSPAFGAVREYPRRVVRHEGTRDRWETSWKVTTAASAQTLLENMDKAFGEAGWKRQGPGAFRYEGDGGAWTETTRVVPAAGDTNKGYIVTTTVARAR